MATQKTDKTLVCAASNCDKTSDNTLQFFSNALPSLHQHAPLWQRAPTRDESGKAYADFMMLIPGLKKFDMPRLRSVLQRLETALMQYEKDIVMVDLNMKINVLWVTLQPKLGLTAEVAAVIHHLVPEAKLVSQHSATE